MKLLDFNKNNCLYCGKALRKRKYMGEVYDTKHHVYHGTCLNEINDYLNMYENMKQYENDSKKYEEKYEIYKLIYKMIQKP
jgi:hypothetical protein